MSRPIQPIHLTSEPPESSREEIVCALSRLIVLLLRVEARQTEQQTAPCSAA